VAEYLNRFTYLSRQAPEEANTNGRKQYHFLNGLHNQIQVQLLNSDYTSFQKLVDKAIIIEAKQAEIERDRKRKLHLKGQQSNANTRLHLMQPQNPFYHSPNTIRPPMPPQRHQFQMQRPNSQFRRWGRIFSHNVQATRRITPTLRHPIQLCIKLLVHSRIMQPYQLLAPCPVVRSSTADSTGTLLISAL
jgi:hypothetical protein